MLQTIAEEVAKESDNVSVISGEERGRNDKVNNLV